MLLGKAAFYEKKGVGLKYISSTCFKSGHNHLQEDFILLFLSLWSVYFVIFEIADSTKL